jgi:hypothetical protein
VKTKNSTTIQPTPSLDQTQNLFFPFAFAGIAVPEEKYFVFARTTVRLEGHNLYGPA